MEIINTFKQSIAKRLRQLQNINCQEIQKNSIFCFATDEDGCAVEIF